MLNPFGIFIELFIIVHSVGFACVVAVSNRRFNLVRTP